MGKTRSSGGSPRNPAMAEKLLDAAEAIICEDGYAAVSSRRIAEIVGVTAPVIHYYYPSMDDLFVALYRRTANKYVVNLYATLQSKNIVRALWNVYHNSAPSSTSAEFIALANHRKSIGEEIETAIRYTRLWQAEALAPALKAAGIDTEECPPLGVAVLIGCIARAFAMDEVVGIDDGHDEALAVLDFLFRLTETDADESAPV